MLKDLIIRNRSYRRFYEDYHIDRKTLNELVDLARLSPSAANLQPLRYYLSSEKKTNELIFETLAWAGYLKDWKGPAEGERPSAYIIILEGKDAPKYADYDVGIVSQSILLGAVEKGLGGCIIGSVEKDLLKEKINVPGKYNIKLVLALGKPKEKVVLEEVMNDEIEYWRGNDGVHHVPKRKLDDIILK